MHSDRQYLKECTPFCGVSLWFRGHMQDITHESIIEMVAWYHKGPFVK